MSGLTRKLGAALFAGTLLAALPLSAHAQESVWNVDLQAGYEMPIQDLGDMADPGPAFGLSFGRMVHEQVAIRLGGSATLYSGEENIPFTSGGPDMKLFTYYASVEANIFDPNLTDWKMLLSAGGGGAMLNSDDFSGDHSLSEHWPMARFGVKAAHPLTESIDGFLTAEGTWIYMDAESDAMTELRRIHPHKLSTVNQSWSFPISAGLRISF